MAQNKIYCIDFGDEKALFRLDKNKKEKEILFIAMNLIGPSASQRYPKDSDTHTQTLHNSDFKQYKSLIKKVNLNDLPLYVGWGWHSNEFMELIKQGMSQ